MKLSSRANLRLMLVSRLRSTTPSLPQTVKAIEGDTPPEIDIMAFSKPGCKPLNYGVACIFLTGSAWHQHLADSTHGSSARHHDALDYAFFFDFDGTLTELAETPSGVILKTAPARH
jgi:hypothetical protein